MLRLLREGGMEEHDYLITYPTAASRIGISLTTLYSYVSRGLLVPVRRAHMRPMFWASYIDQIIEHGYETILE